MALLRVDGGRRFISATRAIVIAAMFIGGWARLGQAQDYAASGLGLSGYIGADLTAPSQSFTYGISFYSSVYPLNPAKSELIELGWGASLIPDNEAFEVPLCPPGTYAATYFPGQSPFRRMFQSFDGGVGRWRSSNYPSSLPKFRIGATPDCYSTLEGSPGWPFGGYAPLPVNRLGLAQLSNRILLPPDGMSFVKPGPTAVFGYGWIALPLIGAHTSALGAPTGDQSWTLFFHAANFKGPVAFFVPDTWSALGAESGVPKIFGRGHDARPALSPGVGLTLSGTPAFTATASNGVQYRRIPKLTFDVDAMGWAGIVRDVTLYSKVAIWAGVQNWLDRGVPVREFTHKGGIAKPTVSGSHVGLSLGGEPISLSPRIFAGGGAGPPGAKDNNYEFGLQWIKSLTPGVLPEYFKKVGTVWEPVLAAEVPLETRLATRKFPVAAGHDIAPLGTSSSSPWEASKWTAGPFTAKLSDSLVEYVWYKFIDQPAIAQLGLEGSELLRLQTFVESLHERAGVDGPTFPAPSSGTPATLDSRLIVKPPPGLERGYVPIVIRQYYVTSGELAALEALHTSTNGSAWTNSSNWLTGPVHSWHGVTVGYGVTGLDLSRNNLAGPLPLQLGNLTNLRLLALSQNELTGAIPLSTSKLKNLRFFSVYDNNLTGPLPSLSNLSTLILFQAGRNQLSGPIPTSFGKLASLEYLFLAENQFSGGLPSTLGKVTRLRQLDVSFNPLSGPLPASLTNLTLMDTFRFNNTSLCVPATGGLNNWLASIATVAGSGLPCPP